MPPRKVKYEDIQWPASIDADHTIESFQNKSYKDLAGIVLNDKYDIRYSAAAGTPSTAVAFAKKKRLKAKLDQDINQDGVDDIILYDVNGNPVYINGYHFRPSEFLLRKEYDERFPNKEHRVRIGGYSGFKKGFHTAFNPEARQEYLARVNDARYLDAHHNSKYLIPKARQPRANASLYQKFSKEIVPHITRFIKHYVLSVNPNKSHATSCLPVMEITSILYIKVILTELWNRMDADANLAQIKNHIKEANADPVARYNALKSVLSSKRYKDIVDAFIGSHWQTIFELVMDERELSELFKGAGFTPELIANNQIMPDDTQIKNMPDAKVVKMRIKEQVARWMKSYKDNLIRTIFSIPDEF